MNKQNQSVLIVEDESIVAMDVQLRLETEGYTVVGVTDTGEEAVKLALELRPQIILMDIKLRGELTGIQATEQILAEMDTKVVFMTAYSDGETMRAIQKTGAVGYVIKPFLHKDLQDVLTQTGDEADRLN